MSSTLKVFSGILIGVIFATVVFIYCFRWEIQAGEDFERQFLGYSEEEDANAYIEEGELIQAALMLEEVSKLKTESVELWAYQELLIYGKLFVIYEKLGESFKSDEAANTAIKASQRALRKPINDKESLKEYLKSIPSIKHIL